MNVGRDSRFIAGPERILNEVAVTAVSLSGPERILNEDTRHHDKRFLRQLLQS